MHAAISCLPVGCIMYSLFFFLNLEVQLALIVSNSVDSNFRLSLIFIEVQTSLCINIYNLTPVESNSDESKFQLSPLKVLVPSCLPFVVYLHSLSRIYLSKHVYYLDIFTLGYFTCLFHNLSN